MRFRATIANEQLMGFTNHVRLLSELCKTAIIHLGADSVRTISVVDDDGLMLYATLETARSFSEFRIESKTDNLISLEVSMSNLLHALKSGGSAHAVVLKLTKKGACAYLAVHTQVVEGGIAVIQEVPVRVLGPAEMARFSEPVLPAPTVQLVVPSLRALQPCVDKMKALSKVIKVEADMTKASMALSVASDTVSVKSFLRNLTRSEVEHPAEEVEVAVVNARTFAKVLKSALPLQLHVLVCMCPGKALVLHFSPEGATFTFILSLMTVADVS